MKTCALILAAGKGTRMHSAKPKVLQSLLGESMLDLVHDNLSAHFAEDDIWTVVGFGAERIEKIMPNAHLIKQNEQLGTGHALATALPSLKEKGYTHVLVINGDAPLISEEILGKFIEEGRAHDLTFATILVDNVGSYGRVVRKDGALVGVIEAKNYDEALYGRPSGEINAGLYVFSLQMAEELLPKIERNPVSGEYYITDLVSLALEAKKSVLGLNLGHDSRLLGVNSPLELEQMEEWLRAQIVQTLLEKGVLIHAKESVRISPRAQIEAGCEIYGPCEIYGKSVVRKGACIESHCVILESEIGTDSRVRSFSHLEGALLAERCIVGPFARLRSGAVLEDDAHVGNYVELKKARLGRGSKANHLSYLGDAEIGASVNIGAGTITCNYDGKKKHPTSIGEHAFIGSNTALVAPVSVGKNALVGAGSTITHDVPDNTLAVTRPKQRNLPRRLVEEK